MVRSTSKPDADDNTARGNVRGNILQISLEQRTGAHFCGVATPSNRGRGSARNENGPVRVVNPRRAVSRRDARAHRKLTFAAFARNTARTTPNDKKPRREAGARSNCYGRPHHRLGVQCRRPTPSAPFDPIARQRSLRASSDCWRPMQRAACRRRSRFSAARLRRPHRRRRWRACSAIQASNATPASIAAKRSPKTARALTATSNSCGWMRALLSASSAPLPAAAKTGPRPAQDFYPIILANEPGDRGVSWLNLPNVT